MRHLFILKRVYLEKIFIIIVYLFEKKFCTVNGVYKTFIYILYFISLTYTSCSIFKEYSHKYYIYFFFKF